MRISFVYTEHWNPAFWDIFTLEDVLKNIHLRGLKLKRDAHKRLKHKNFVFYTCKQSRILKACMVKLQIGQAVMLST